MIFIDMTNLQIDSQWKIRAEEAMKSIKNSSEEERAATIDKFSFLWAELKPIFESLSHKKCWYCECREIRFDKEMDHFRPKNQVVGSRGHLGYWWLCLDYHNLRYCCKYCNPDSKR